MAVAQRGLYNRTTGMSAAKRHWAGQTVAQTGSPGQGSPSRSRARPGWLAADARGVERPARGRRGTSGRGTPRPAAGRACAHKRATGLSSGCYGLAVVSWALCFTVDLRRCCRCSADHVLATLQTVTGTVVWSRAGGSKLRRAHETITRDGPDEPDEVSLDAQPGDDWCAVTARPARRSAQSGRLVCTFSPQRRGVIQPRF